MRSVEVAVRRVNEDLLPGGIRVPDRDPHPVRAPLQSLGVRCWKRGRLDDPVRARSVDRERVLDSGLCEDCQHFGIRAVFMTAGRKLGISNVYGAARLDVPHCELGIELRADQYFVIAGAKFGVGYPTKSACAIFQRRRPGEVLQGPNPNGILRGKEDPWLT